MRKFTNPKCMSGGINMYFHRCVSLLVPVCAVYLCMYVCETHTRVILALTYQSLTFIDP